MLCYVCGVDRMRNINVGYYVKCVLYYNTIYVVN